MVRAERVHFAVELDASHAVAKINQRGSGIFFTTPLDFFATVDRPHRRRELVTAPKFLRSQLPVLASGGDFGSSLYHVFRPAAKSLSTFAATGLAFFFHASDCGLDASGIPEFERAEFPLKPRRMARSISTIEFEISGTRFAE